MRRLIMLSLFQGCLGLSFKKWTGLSCVLTMDRMAGLQNLQDRLFWLSCGLTMDRMAGFAYYKTYCHMEKL
jgi:hypothetical protein